MESVSVIDQGSLISTLSIRLHDLMGSAQAWGKDHGDLVAHALQEHIEAVQPWVVRLSLAGVERMDVSFAAEIVRLASYARACCGGRRGFCLVDGSEKKDLLSNWHAAALVQHQPLFVWERNTHHLLGPAPSPGLREMLRYVLISQRATTTSAAAKELHLKIPNASNKLNALGRAGYLLRLEQSAESGGIEYEYLCIA